MVFLKHIKIHLTSSAKVVEGRGISTWNHDGQKASQADAE